MKTLKLLSLQLSLLAIGCSPYANQFNSIEGAYARGEITADSYYAEKGRLTALDQQWRVNMAHSINSFNQDMQRQQEINAYNARTNDLSRPQQLNINHSGTINHNVYGY
jgi:hypothetical protein